MVYRGYDNLRQGLVLHLPFSEGVGTSVKDTSQYANNGTLGAGARAPTWTEGIEGGRALDFTNDHILVPHSDSLNPLSAITIAMLLTTDALSGAWRYYIYKPQKFAIFINTSNRFGMELNVVTDWAHAVSTTILPVISTGFFVAGSYSESDSTLRLYVNGILAASDSSESGAIDSTLTDIFIGSSGPASWYDVDGKIDRVLMYNRALNAIEHRSLANLRGII